ncbi:hypothetical protein ACEPNE_002988 [Pseudomonas aeruginosa]|uniref:hypothetical protein n=1 Tax=Pseudomonas aeruginosa TaxID=287 RepID=UPI0032E3955A|nr:hypothetical protein [Pseudomonas aeruginosa]HBO8921739.1 hypothetical protein [Pseudomonas aeruginosa]HBO9030313.1 hypothetical protein [Pseudomonas aeruginosa]HBO9102410.1 hypothetical protein [Pseudomonas aeruginosa]HBO9179717.1 hypothetical protein [Pseudomonas aeruginosa]
MEEEQQAQADQTTMTSFRAFCRGRVASHLLEYDGERFKHPAVQLLFEAFQHGQARPTGQQLYAGIRESSKYHSQIDWCIRNGYGHPFPIWFEASLDGYVVIGGAGGRYRLDDVDLYVMDGSMPVRVS